MRAIIINLHFFVSNQTEAQLLQSLGPGPVVRGGYLLSSGPKRGKLVEQYS